METYAPSPEARSQARRIAAMSIVNDETPIQTVTKMSMACVETDFNGSITTAENEAIITFNVHFMMNICDAMMSHMNGDFSTTPRDD